MSKLEEEIRKTGFSSQDVKNLIESIEAVAETKVTGLWLVDSDEEELCPSGIISDDLRSVNIPLDLRDIENRDSLTKITEIPQGILYALSSRQGYLAGGISFASTIDGSGPLYSLLRALSYIFNKSNQPDVELHTPPEFFKNMDFEEFKNFITSKIELCKFSKHYVFTSFNRSEQNEILSSKNVYFQSKKLQVREIITLSKQAFESNKPTHFRLREPIRIPLLGAGQNVMECRRIIVVPVKSSVTNFCYIGFRSINIGLSNGCVNRLKDVSKYSVGALNIFSHAQSAFNRGREQAFTVAYARVSGETKRQRHLIRSSLASIKSSNTIYKEEIGEWVDREFDSQKLPMLNVGNSISKKDDFLNQIYDLFDYHNAQLSQVGMLLKQMAKSAHIDELERVRTPLHSIVRRAVRNELVRAAELGVQIGGVDDLVGSVKCVPSLIEYAVFLIVQNALDCFERRNDLGGRRRIRISLDIKSRTEARPYVLQIEDNAGGVKLSECYFNAAKPISSISDIFQVGTSTRHSTLSPTDGIGPHGQGLNAAKFFIEFNHGTLSVTEGSNGAIFIIRLGDFN